MEVKEIMVVAAKVAATIAALLVTAVFGTIGALLKFPVEIGMNSVPEMRNLVQS